MLSFLHGPNFLPRLSGQDQNGAQVKWYLCPTSAQCPSTPLLPRSSMLYKCWLLASKHLNTSENFKGWRHTGTGCFTGNRPWFGWLSFYISCFLALLLHLIGKWCHASPFSLVQKMIIRECSIEMANLITWSKKLHENHENNFWQTIQSAPNLVQP